MTAALADATGADPGPAARRLLTLADVTPLIRPSLPEASMSSQQTFLIIGAGLAGARAAQTLREEGFTGRIRLVGAETEPPYERPPLSKTYLTGVAGRDTLYVHEPSWYDEQDVELRLGVRATGLDAAAHQVILGTGERLRYDRCCWAPARRRGA